MENKILNKRTMEGYKQEKFKLKLKLELNRRTMNE